MTAGSEQKYSVLYLGYASNLSPVTMSQRCPDSLYVGMARIDDWKWQINQTGYGNIIPSKGDVVYGSLSFLSHRDEAALDHSEGVPWLYEKHVLNVTRLMPDGSDGQHVNAMTYVDLRQITPGKIDQDYVVWINKSIVDGVKCGIPSSYVEKYIRPYTPDEEIREIIMVRTRTKADGGSVQANEHRVLEMLKGQNLGNKKMDGWIFGAGSGGLRDGSTA